MDVSLLLFVIILQTLPICYTLHLRLTRQNKNLFALAVWTLRWLPPDRRATTLSCILAPRNISHFSPRILGPFVVTLRGVLGVGGGGRGGGAVRWCGGIFKALCLSRGQSHLWWKRSGLTLPALNFGNWLLMISANISGNSTLRDLFTKV